MKMEDGIYEQESSLMRSYAALSPNNPNDIGSPPFPDLTYLSKLENQVNLFNLLESNPHLSKSNTSNRWRLSFWKRVIRTLQPDSTLPKEEEIEIDERILTHYISLLQEKTTPSPAEPNAPDQDSNTEIHTYFYGDLNDRTQWSCISLCENKACIFNGTTGLRSWGASVCLANYLILNPRLLKQEYDTVLELGSGTGLLGILASQLNPNNRVFLTDHNPSVLDRLELNISLNFSHGNLLGKKDSLSVKCLDWNSSLSTSPCSDHLSVINKDGPLLLLGADVIYDPDLVLGLVLTVKHYLQVPSLVQLRSRSRSSLALICTIVRDPKTWDLFLSTCRNQGLCVKLMEVDEALKLASIDRPGIIFAQSLDQSDKDQNQFKLVSLQLEERI